MKCRTKQVLMKRVNSQTSFVTTFKPCDTGTSYKWWHRIVGQQLPIVFLLISMGVGLGTITAQARPEPTSPMHPSTPSTRFGIDTGTNTVVATIPVGKLPLG